MRSTKELTGHFDKPPDPNYILSVLIDIYERQYGCKLEVVKK